MMLPLIPIIILLFTTFFGVTMLFWIATVIQIISVVMIIVLAPFLVKILSDYILYFEFGLSKEVSLILGILMSIPILIILYVNSFWLIVGSMLIFGIYLGARFYFSRRGKKTIGKMLKWFEEKK